ncbi:MAG: hypothetical protein IKY83_02890 [Proteobacteria bacterium]|nr:hypothetical protein [Pseudomonadota bacterium]
MFGLGVPEIIAIIVIATIILGPEHMPKAARMIGRWSAKIRSAATSFNEAVTQDRDLNEIRTELGEVRTELLSAKRDLSLAGREVSQVSEHAHAAFEEAQAELKKLQATTGRDMASDAAVSESDHAESGEDAVRHADAGVSAFLSRPMGRLGGDEPQEKPGVCAPDGAVRLAAPVLLPGPVSRLVTRRRVQLDMPSPSAETGQACVSLEKADARRCCPLIRRLEPPQTCATQGVRLTRIRLDHV